MGGTQHTSQMGVGDDERLYPAKRGDFSVRIYIYIREQKRERVNGLYKMGNICPAAGPFPISKRRRRRRKKKKLLCLIYHGVVVVGSTVVVGNQKSSGVSPLLFEHNTQKVKNKKKKMSILSLAG
jgi:hypothetical protein